MAPSGQIKRKKIGLLGGSFNPGHDGHVYISEKAIEILGLDEVWWLVSPQNPLKSSEDLASFEQRLKEAQKLTTSHPHILVSDLELRLNTHYTVDTLRALKQLHPDIAFVWLMGADNLLQIHQWREWQTIFHLVPVAVFDRNGCVSNWEKSEAAEQFLSFRKTNNFKQLATSSAPAWAFLPIEKHSASSTAIRKKRQK
jgi:nicotinate-nucleotide adenylyltransferase